MSSSLPDSLASSSSTPVLESSSSSTTSTTQEVLSHYRTFLEKETQSKSSSEKDSVSRVDELRRVLDETLKELKKLNESERAGRSGRDVTPALAVLRDFFSGKPSARGLPPQIIVCHNISKAAFGRNTLSTMDYTRACELFAETFRFDEDARAHYASQSGWFSAPYKPPEVLLYATFCHKVEGNGFQGPVLLSRSSWSELIENVEELHIVVAKPYGDESN